MARAAGRRTGLFTSPHLESVGDQVRLDGVPVPDAELGELLDEVLAAAGRAGVDAELTAFEALAAAAVLAFARARVDLAVVEAGMGGARDATNVLEPQLAIVTTVGRDHEAFLGTDLAAIARDKAGVFRRGRPAIWGWIDNAADAALARRVQEIGATAWPAWRRIRRLERCDGHIELKTDHRNYRLKPSLAGEHQARNLALAVLAAEALGLEAKPIAGGARRCRWPGRLEKIDTARPVVLDAAHNESAAAALAAWIDEQGEPVDLVFGALGDKDAAAMLGLLVPRARRVVLTAPDDPRAIDPRRLRDHVSAIVSADVTVEPSLAAAVTGLLAVANDGLVVVTGSLRLVAQVRRLMKSQNA